MRDDLHKASNLPQSYKRVAKYLYRSADRCRARDAFFFALQEEAVKAIGQAQIVAALRACKQVPLVFDGEEEQSRSDLPALAAQMKRRNPEIPDEEIVRHAMELKIGELKEARQREMQSAIFQSAPPHAVPELIAAARENLEISSQDIADNIFSGQPISSLRYKNLPIDPDEDLSI